MDETRIDAAPTPAHIFAYRAFRGVFYQSPDSSPVRRTEDRIKLESKKENGPIPPTRTSRFATSPVNTKRKGVETDLASLNISLTPKKQKTIPVSPSKSILKKANVPTPRKLGLRDVTVTFKDARASISPELARRGSPQRVRSQPQNNSDVFRSLVSKNAYPTGASIEAAITTMPRKSVPDFDLGAYKAQTEKEIRRLMKYGQKWKEQAKRYETENLNLQTLLADARKQNERLNNRLLQSQQLGAVRSPSLRDQVKRKASLQEKTKELYTIEPHLWRSFESETTQALEKRTARAYATNGYKVDSNVQKTSDPTSRTAEQDVYGRPHQQHHDSQPSYTTTAGAPRSEALKHRTSTPSENRSASRSDSDLSAIERAQSTSRAKDVDVQTPRTNSRALMSLTANTHHRDELRKTHELSQTRAVSNPDPGKAERLAAARLRLQHRRQARGTSISLSPTGTGGSISTQAALATKDLSSITERDNTQVDWVGV
ncbi:hypothetical protein LTR05_000231 [Lithohypha guttulata]|uniref:Uncharacterized protein n=1 Tax=Lithohypha guttulata TaxID=1690604 RepID=A0AAN7YDN5_9EURO|nr:hypothetical protein LTR05_000231 [Lithohypha guttulata]